MNSSAKYLARNLTLVSQLIGQTIQHIIRLMYLEPEDELRMESGSLLLETNQSSRLYLDVDEGRGNILVFDASDTSQPINYTISKFPYKYTVFPEGYSQGLVTSLLDQPVSKIEVISRPDKDYNLHSMCGFRLTVSPGHSVCIGAYLTDLKIPDLWILTPEEMDTNLHYQAVTPVSE
ncbi:MAG: hypothetical protein RID53_25860 [Coleofasciculus sp. B1-GNL1-01]|uniref:hypothetical protein n=1 Tax=Coleofasciculus sp. B1-GNL1-01 TaxID=3068484 RepID=UPI0032F8E933